MTFVSNLKKKSSLFLLAISFLVLTLFSPHAAQAKILRLFNSSNEDIILKKLKEKQVLSDEDINDIQKEKQKEAEKHSINLSARIQSLFTYNDSVDGGGPDANDFNVRRLRFQVDGFLYKNIDFKFEFHADKLTTVGLKDAWAGFKKYPLLRFRIGQFKTPFSRQRVTSSAKLQLIERSLVQVFYPGRDIGAEVSGTHKLFSYGVSMLGGAGDSLKFKDVDNGNFLFTSRAAIHPLGPIPLSEGDGKSTDRFRFEIAGNAMYAPGQVAFGERSINNVFNAFSAYGINSLTSAPNGRTIIYGGEFSARYKGFSFTFEGYYATFKPNSSQVTKIVGTRRNISSYGFFAQAGYFIIPHYLEIAGRYEQLDIDQQVTNSDDIKAITGGLNYFIKKSHSLKLQANFIREMRSSFENSHIVMVNAQIKY